MPGGGINESVQRGKVVNVMYSGHCVSPTELPHRIVASRKLMYRNERHS